MNRVVTTLCSLAVVTLVASSNAAAQSDGFLWFTPEAKDGVTHAWIRWALDGPVADAKSVRLTVASNGTCSVSVNGQRILRHATLDDAGAKAAGFEIASLLRSGRNTVAVEVQSEHPGVAVGLRVARGAGDQYEQIGGGFRAATELPPVGWQQTDFNDRDWPEIQPASSVPELASRVATPESFAAPVVPAKRRVYPVRFEDGDHVVLVGATFFERAQLSEHLEATLAGTCGDRHVTFRNLGWSADTAFSDSRGIFDAPEVGYLRLVEHIRAEEPTLAIICYGQNEALTAGMTPDQFQEQLGRLLDELAASGIACVLVSPHELFPARPPLPSPSRFNSRIELFSGAAESVANSRGLLFVNLFSSFQQQMRQIDDRISACCKLPPGTATANTTSGGDNSDDVAWSLADNGMHLTEHGYAIASVILRERLMAIPAQIAAVEINPARKSVSSALAGIRNVAWSDDGLSVTFEQRDQLLSPLPVRFSLASDDAAAVRRLQIRSDASESGGAADGDSQYTQLRRLIQRKNELYFHRWRPQNVTYLFGFRKHEQGNNAADIARFDPFIQELERQIHDAQQPRWKTVTASWSE